MCQLYMKHVYASTPGRMVLYIVLVHICSPLASICIDNSLLPSPFIYGHLDICLLPNNHLTEPLEVSVCKRNSDDGMVADVNAPGRHRECTRGRMGGQR
jgi:hypothetical protein